MQRITPKNKEHWLQLRAQDITSTEVSALFGISPYMTKLELWHSKRDRDITTIKENERMKWGTRLETAIAKGVAEDEGWVVEPLKDYIRDEEHRIGSSFDFAIGDDGILEIKNVDGLAFRDGWTVDDEGNIEAPPHIELQVQHQMLVSGRSFAYIAALVGGNRVALIERKPDAQIFNAILDKVGSFWNSVETNTPPAVDYERDAELLIALAQDADADKTIEPNDHIDALAITYRDISDEIKELEIQKKSIKAQILEKIGDASKVKGERYTVSAGMTKESRVEAFTRHPFRNFRINWKKEK